MPAWSYPSPLGFSARDRVSSSAPGEARDCSHLRTELADSPGIAIRSSSSPDLCFLCRRHPPPRHHANPRPSTNSRGRSANTGGWLAYRNVPGLHGLQASRCRSRGPTEGVGSATEILRAGSTISRIGHETSSPPATQQQAASRESHRARAVLKRNLPRPCDDVQHESTPQTPGALGPLDPCRRQVNLRGRSSLTEWCL